MRFFLCLLIFVVSAGALRAQCDGAEPVLTTIPLAQGPCLNRVVTVTGVVVLTSRPLGGFWLQDAAGDNDAQTSDGIFVFQSSGATEFPSAGTLVRATGRVVDFTRATYTGALRQLDIRPATTPLSRLEILSTGAALPPPAVLDPRRENAAVHLRARLGMRVAYPQAAVVMPANGFGEYFALRYDRLPVGVRVTDAVPGDGQPLLIDDTGDAFRKPAKTFDLVPALTGVLHFDFGAYRLLPAADYALDDAGLKPLPLRAMSGTLRIVSMNVERLVSTLTATARETKLAKLALVIREVLASPEVIAVEEVGSAELLAELGRRAGGYQSLWFKSCDFSGIAVGVLWKPASVSKTGERVWQAEAPDFRNGRCTLEDGRQFTQFLFDRPSLAVDFAAGALEFTLVVNHWRSQIGGNEAERLAGAEFITREVERLGNRLVVAAGDFNDTELSAPLRALGPLANLTERVPVEERYSLLFEGRSQAFDHILVSPALLPRVAGHGYAHHNADFPNDGNAGDGGSPVRAADHDVPWVAIRIP